MNVSNQAHLIRNACRGDPHSFEKLVKAYYPSILNYSYRLLSNRSDAEDVTQEVFLKVANKLSSLKQPDAFKSWVYSIANSTCLDLIRKRTREKVHARNYYHACSLDEALPVDFSIWESVARLPIALKQAVVLVYWEGFNHAQAGSILECAESTVSWRIHEAKKQLKGMLEECP